MMYVSADTLDDLLHKVLSDLLRSRGSAVSASRGATRERSGVLLRLRNPRARLSRTSRRTQVFSCVGELAWYLAKSDRVKFISYYIPKYREDSEDGLTIPTAYGPRIFSNNGEDQLGNVVDLLHKRRSSRRAVIQIYSAGDIHRIHDVPCTCTLQFLVRKSRLHMLTSMRSNDAYLGLPHDIFSFTMLQEIVARALGIELGEYKHFVGSLHLYDEHMLAASLYVDDGYQERVAMPAMPFGNQFPNIKMFLNYERKIRNGRSPNLDRLGMDPYWEDLLRLLRAYRFFKDKDSTGMTRQVSKLHSEVYAHYVELKSKRVSTRASSVPAQESLFTEQVG
ncbi:thymidylate synthase [Luteimonas sp. 22616]|uniref:thymidylate synthase n=1 Tax=Luteimonas sp. 22616 TaxID=3453951 RepID=UPI003F848A23